VICVVLHFWYTAKLYIFVLLCKCSDSPEIPSCLIYTEKNSRSEHKMFIKISIVGLIAVISISVFLLSCIAYGCCSCTRWVTCNLQGNGVYFCHGYWNTLGVQCGCRSLWVRIRCLLDTTYHRWLTFENLMYIILKPAILMKIFMTLSKESLAITAPALQASMLSSYWRRV
jgi:hypothetical protein